MPRTTRAKTSTTTSQASSQPAKRGTKRKSTDESDTNAASTSAASRKRTKAAKSTASDAPQEDQRPRLTTPDLEFDYDRTQLRDPRPTPGRVRRPRLEFEEITEEFKKQFFIPQPERPKGRLNASQKAKFDEEKTLLDPSETFHDTYVCLKKGPRGQATYDSAGFRLDYKKVAETMRPQAYNKSRIVKGMEDALDRAEREEKELIECFFVKGDVPGYYQRSQVGDYAKDHISKDLGVPWHQIGSKHFRQWSQKGFEKKKYSTWWREPNEEEQKRMDKMTCGSDFRRDL
ncbi:hypothetical protein F4777DRAFT_457362 [Nemania sp. FL0916]|nr:hypothetical protein F4777DRAFT_457362 [Nemania sp. FL0916]